MLSLMDLLVDCSNEQERVSDWFAGDDLFTPMDRRKGLPIGNLTSQWFANWYLNDLDHFVTGELRLGAYVRYCDDFLVLAREAGYLREAVGQIQAFLAGRRLRLHPGKLFVRPVRAGVRFVGYRIWPTRRLLPKERVRQFRRRVRWMKRAYAQYRMGRGEVKNRLMSWVGHARQADSFGLLQYLSREWVFERGEAEWPACSPGRLVEQQPEQRAGREPQQEHA